MRICGNCEPVGTLTKPRPGKWRREPGNLSHAAEAAAYYAKRDDVPMIVLEGNSYMHRVYHVVRQDDDLARVCPGAAPSVPAIVAYPNGRVLRCTVSRDFPQATNGTRQAQ